MNYVSCLGITLSVIGLLGLGVAGPGYRVGLWGFKTGITLVKYAGYISVAALVVCLVGLALWQAQVFPQGMIPALVGLVIGGCVLGLTLKWKHNLDSVPYIHDITTDAGLAELKTLKNLQKLVIGYNEKMTGTGLAELKDLKNLQHLVLIHSSITDEGAKSLAELHSLKTIDLRGTQITDAGLKVLQSLRNLKELNLCLVPGGPFDVTRDGIKELQAALPETKILR